MKLDWSITLVLISFFFLNMIQSKRLFVFEHFRHGARGPLKEVNAKNEDIFKEKWNGIGELSPVGLRMLYLLGIKNKKRYSYFIQPVFDTNEILIYSTNANRSITSANAYMQGLYPEPTKIILDSTQKGLAYPQKIDKSKLEQAINALGSNVLPNQMSLFPIHIFNPFERTFLLNDIKICPGIMKHKAANVQSSQMIKVVNELYNKFDSSFGSKLREYFNQSDLNYYHQRETIFTLSDTFITDYTDAREMKEFKETQIDLNGLHNISQEIAYIDTYLLEFTSENNMLSIMAMSPTFQSIIAWMEKRIRKDKEGKDHEIHGSEPRMVIYSGHDTTMATMHLFMEEVFKIKINDHTYASNQHFELIENDKQYTVEYYSNDDKKLEMPFDEFSSKINKVIWRVDQINDFCNEVTINPYFISTIVLACLTALLLLLQCFVLKKRKSKAIATQ